MDWTQILFLFLSNAALIVWFRSESRTDWRLTHQEMSADRKDLIQLIREIKDELKEFHGRMCSIEERNRK